MPNELKSVAKITGKQPRVATLPFWQSNPSTSRLGVRQENVTRKSSRRTSIPRHGANESQGRRPHRRSHNGSYAYPTSRNLNCRVVLSIIPYLRSISLRTVDIAFLKNICVFTSASSAAFLCIANLVSRPSSRQPWSRQIIRHGLTQTNIIVHLHPSFAQQVLSEKGFSAQAGYLSGKQKAPRGLIVWLACPRRYSTP